MKTCDGVSELPLKDMIKVTEILNCAPSSLPITDVVADCERLQAENLNVPFSGEALTRTLILDGPLEINVNLAGGSTISFGDRKIWVRESLMEIWSQNQK